MAQYIIRLDDACPTMDTEKWDLFETLLDNLNIKPIVAVIPNNKDANMFYEEEDKNFWKKVNTWQLKGWEIALHGYDHTYITKGCGLVPINNQSEFVGLTLSQQKEKIKLGWKIFQEQGINSNIWIAPSHTFDKNTLQALREETTIRIISDGISFFPFNKYGFFWIPQQIWQYSEKKNGIYTICYHPNMMSIENIIKEFDLIKINKDKFINNIKTLEVTYFDKTRSLLDTLYSKKFFIKRKIILFMIKYIWSKK